MIFTPVSEDDPRLRHECAELTRAQLRGREQQVEIDALLDYVYGKSNKAMKGETVDRAKPTTVGLSANQVGVMKQISIVDLSIGRKGYNDMHVLINPKITWRSKAVVEKAEGCVNFKTIWGVTRRSRTVEVVAMDRSGNEISLKVTGWAAILLQHEVDHLAGRLFIDRLVDPKRADLVKPKEYEAYRKMKADWPRKTDVSAKVVTD
jgi:peptide deformylase